MKKKLLTLSLALLVLLCGCSTKEDPNKGIDETVNLFPVSKYEDTLEITLGDVMPFYDNGEMNIYHLQNSRGTNSMYYHPISRLTTKDYLHYEDKGISINFVEEYNHPDAAIGTGSFIKDPDGLYHCYYTGHNAAAGTGLPFIEVVRHATSTDQETWICDESFNLYGNNNDFRDPYVYYDSIDQKYYMLVTTRENNVGVIKRYASDSLEMGHQSWRDVGVFFYNDDGNYNMECPSYIEYNNYYYLAYSEQGDNRVTHYRYRTSHDGEWKKFERDSIDASGFYAGRLEKGGDKLYAFAWCANLTGGFVGEFDWGGNLVSHEIKQSENGELNAVPIENVYNELSTQVKYKTVGNKTVDSIKFNEDKFSSLTFEKLKKEATRINYKFKYNSDDGDFGLTFNVNKTNNRLGTAVIAFEPKNNRLACYNNVSNIIRYGDVLASVPFSFEKNKSYEVNAIIQNEIMTIYFNDTVALTVRLPGIKKKNFGFYSHKANVQFEEVKFYV